MIDDEKYLPALRGKGDVHLIIFCPYCRVCHRHGAAGKTFGSGDGWRRPHCLERGKYPDYYLREVGWLTRENVIKFFVRKKPRNLGTAEFVTAEEAVKLDALRQSVQNQRDLGISNGL
jgi:hypothetical protein